MKFHSVFLRGISSSRDESLSRQKLVNSKTGMISSRDQFRICFQIHERLFL